MTPAASTKTRPSDCRPDLEPPREGKRFCISVSIRMLSATKRSRSLEAWIIFADGVLTGAVSDLSGYLMRCLELTAVLGPWAVPPGGLLSQSARWFLMTLVLPSAS